MSALPTGIEAKKAMNELSYSRGLTGSQPAMDRPSETSQVHNKSLKFTEEIRCSQTALRKLYRRRAILRELLKDVETRYNLAHAMHEIQQHENKYGKLVAMPPDDEEKEVGSSTSVVPVATKATTLLNILEQDKQNDLSNRKALERSEHLRKDALAKTQACKKFSGLLSSNITQDERTDRNASILIRNKAVSDFQDHRDSLKIEKLKTDHTAVKRDKLIKQLRSYADALKYKRIPLQPSRNRLLTKKNPNPKLAAHKPLPKSKEQLEKEISAYNAKLAYQLRRRRKANAKTSLSHPGFIKPERKPSKQLGMKKVVKHKASKAPRVNNISSKDVRNDHQRPSRQSKPLITASRGLKEVSKPSTSRQEVIKLYKSFDLPIFALNTSQIEQLSALDPDWERFVQSKVQ